MKKWPKHISGAVGMGLVWAAGWTLVGMLGVVVFYTLFPNVPDVVDIWIPLFAYPGFFGGVIFSIVIKVAEGRRRFDELSLPRLAIFGAVVGLLLGVLLFALVTLSDGFPLWLHGVTIVGSTILLSVISAVGSALLFRYGAQRKIHVNEGSKP
jgi:hypothetical protein